ncbi:hypothetical protein SS50377_26428 [Spironucleus salmonicida]|uniref:Uncharacterized protein n=1 Tax=Spironucleus salmonicida TaxID=348837 RepID=V6LT05_9EUKA|nr:hypothetical protein SS50377_26428 [Spironucleus salmonicida]|eukprot:EST47705.1 Hypothetical protein SS50377_12101 [Spironucleus salmonicida]
MKLNSNVSKKLNILKHTPGCDSCKLSVAQDLSYFIIGIKDKLDQLQLTCSFRQYLPASKNVPSIPISKCKICGRNQLFSCLSQVIEEISEEWFFNLISSILHIQFKDLSKKVWQLLDLCKQIDVKRIQSDKPLIENIQIQTDDAEVGYKNNFNRIAHIVNCSSLQPETVIRSIENLIKDLKVHQETDYSKIINNQEEIILQVQNEVQQLQQQVRINYSLFQQEKKNNYSQEVMKLQNKLKTKDEQMEKLHKSQTFNERKTLLNEFARSQRPLSSIDEFKKSFSPRKLISPLSHSQNKDKEEYQPNNKYQKQVNILQQENNRLYQQNSIFEQKLQQLEKQRYSSAKTITFAQSVAKNVQIDQKIIKTQTSVINDQSQEITLFKDNIHVLMQQIVSLHINLSETRKNQFFSIKYNTDASTYVKIFKKILNQLNISQYTQEQISDHFLSVLEFMSSEEIVNKFTEFSGVQSLDLCNIKSMFSESTEIYIVSIMKDYKTLSLIKNLASVDGFMYDFMYPVDLQFNVVCAILCIFGLKPLCKKGYGIPWLVGDNGSFEGVECEVL